jgi:hypothetical protein
MRTRVIKSPEPFLAAVGALSPNRGVPFRSRMKSVG